MLGFQAVVVGEVEAGPDTRADTRAEAADERATLATGYVIVAGPREDFSEPERAAAAIGIGIRLGHHCHGCHRIFSLWPIQAGNVDGR